MLFAYTYVPHKMEKMQEFIDYIFHNVWCSAPTNGAYSLDIYNGYPELCEVMTAFHYDDSKGAEFFSGHVERIYHLFAALLPAQIAQLSSWYQANNDIERVCANDPTTQIVRYADFPVALRDVKEQIEEFFKKLYSRLDIAALKAKIGKIDDHYKTFMETNKVGKCPFCGLNDLLGKDHGNRDAYDHYLPKAIYPFNSINFKNLVPACHHCNSSYKTSKDPAYTPKDPTRTANRRAVFYPYTTSPHALDIHIELRTSDIEKLTRTDINLTFGPAAVNEQIETWKDVYGIEERYEAKLCTESDGKAWLAQVFDEWKELGRDPKDFLETLALNTRNYPFTDCNFLKKPFLDACQAKGLFDALPPVQS
ncbi:hypothetical protein CN03_01530 [Thalassolituus oleivorans]|uniref:HNH endonuclease n=1 Tax=Thalassolituus oleivorans TaxID=187493 RepID=UPI0009492D4A|nr:hypothetical protein [Thalassolituus oleivorans]APR65713.1 hypothetical protein CN03_01530 [Thalassolituus oleivorans]